MAVAYHELRNLVGRIDNDNWPGYFPVPGERPARLPTVRPDALELEYDNLVTRLEPEVGPDCGGLEEWPLDHVVNVLCFCHP